MAAAFAGETFSTLLAQRLANLGPVLQADAILFLDQREEVYRQLALPEDLTHERISHSVDRVANAIILQDIEIIHAITIRGIIDFFCPGLPPIC